MEPSMKTIRGPAIFLAQFAGDAPPFNSLAGMAGWAASLGYTGIQIPTWDARLFDLDKAASSKAYCDEVKGILGKHGLVVTELATHLQGHLVAVHPVYDSLVDGFAAPAVRGKPEARARWAVEQVKAAAKACRNLGLETMVSFTGALAWPFLYPFPQRPAGLVETAFDELARRWKPILDFCDSQGVNVGFELHPGEDLFDGATFEMFIDLYHERIFAFHVKDAEFNPTGRQGVYGGFQPWIGRAGRFRSLGDGQVDFRGIFSRLTQYGYAGWAVLEWECCLKHPEDGAREGSAFIRDHIIRVTERAFDDFAGSGVDQAANRRVLGLDGKAP